MTEKSTEDLTVENIIAEVGEGNVQKVCDKLLERSVELMALVAPPDMIIDRIVTYGVANIVANQGKARAIDVLAGIAHQIEEGGFDAALPPTRN